MKRPWMKSIMLGNHPKLLQMASSKARVKTESNEVMDKNSLRGDGDSQHSMAVFTDESQGTLGWLMCTVPIVSSLPLCASTLTSWITYQFTFMHIQSKPISFMTRNRENSLPAWDFQQHGQKEMVFQTLDGIRSEVLRARFDVLTMSKHCDRVFII